VWIACEQTKTRSGAHMRPRSTMGEEKQARLKFVPAEIVQAAQHRTT
jgi:hypothetical protein